MKKFVVKRVLLSIVILFFVSMIIYAIMRCMPSSFVEQQALTLSQRPGAKSYDEWVAQLNASYGLDTGVIQGYFRWAAKAIRGQFGDSWYFNQPVLTKFASVIWYSFALSLASFVLEIIIAIPAGIAAARKQYSATDYTITVIALVGISLPSFFVATLLKWVFSVKLGWFDLYGIVGRNFQSLSSGRQILDMAWHLVLPQEEGKCANLPRRMDFMPRILRLDRRKRWGRQCWSTRFRHLWLQVRSFTNCRGMHIF